MTTNNKLIRATFLLGLVPLTVGLSIFFSWWTGKAWFLTTYSKLETMGFLWVLVSIPLGLAGLLTGLIFLFKAFKTNLGKGLLGLFCVLINIPVLNWVDNKQVDVDQRAYVGVYNKTDSNFRWLTIENSLFIESFNTLSKGDYKTGYFYPNYDEWDISRAREIEDVILTIRTDKDVKRIIMPTIYKGDCLKLFIDKEFKIEVK
jgi:hypothetical protein